MIKDLAFPIEKIEPINVLSKNKNTYKNKSPLKNDDNPVASSKKIKLVSVNFT